MISSGAFPYVFFMLLSWAFWSVCKVPLELWYENIFTKILSTGYQKKMWQLVAHVFPTEQPVLCHHEAKLWHTDTKKEWESQESQKNIVFVKWHSGKKLFIYLFGKKYFRHTRTKELSIVFLIKMSSAVVAIAKHNNKNNKMRIHKFKNIWIVLCQRWLDKLVLSIRLKPKDNYYLYT